MHVSCDRFALSLMKHWHLSGSRGGVLGGNTPLLTIDARIVGVAPVESFVEEMGEDFPFPGLEPKKKKINFS